MAGWEASCWAVKVSSAICNETQHVRTTGAHQVLAQMADRECVQVCPMPERENCQGCIQGWRR